MSKTVCLTYKYPDPKGFGAWLRTCICVCTYCVTNGWEFDIHLNTNPIRSFIDYKNLRLIDKIYVTNTLKDIKTVIETNPDLNYIFIDHNEEQTLPEHDNDIKVEYYEMRKQKIYNIVIDKVLKYNHLFIKRYTTFLNSLRISPKSYDVLHIRFGDIVLIDERDICTYTKLALYEELDAYVKTHDPSNTLLICDSYWIKLTISQKYNFITLDTVPTHSSLLTDKISILDTLIDFHLLCTARSINVISCVTYISNFSLVAHVLYNIPYTHKKITIPDNKPTCWSCKKLKQRRIKLLRMYVLCKEVQTILDE